MSMCVSGERGRGAAFGVVDFDMEGFDVEGLGFGVATDVDGGGGGGRADILMWVLKLVDDSLMLLSFYPLAAGAPGGDVLMISILDVCL